MSDAGHLSRVRALFDQVVDESPDARAAVLHALDSREPALAHELRALLACHDADAAHLEEGVRSHLIRDRSDESPDWTGRHIGPYRIVRVVGRGGMGTVYEAMRDDAAYERRVAIKVIRGDMDSDAIARRFRRERQILAALDHPNVARLLDGGVQSDGRPYLVMEFVDGEAIDAYCDTRRLDIGHRLALFLRVCDAVDHAHRKLIVHRDLKPGNVLVGADGSPKLLDFGIAKLVAPDADTDASTMTVAGLRFFTPEYASPEQLRGEPVSTSSDVYSLGVLLYELLSGHRPFHMDGSSALNIERLLTTEPDGPSTVVTDAAAQQRAESTALGLRRRLAGDLDHIVLMAIRKEPARRYASVERFAMDLRRFLDGRPVSATGDTAAYRLRKFVKRHRLGVAAGAVATCSLGGGVSATLWQAHLARAASRVASVERAQAEQVTAFITGIIGSADPSWYSGGQRVGPTTTVLEAIQRAAQRVGTDLKGQPDVEATIRRTIGNTYQSLGMPDSAERQLTAAIALRRGAHAAPGVDLAIDLEDLGRVRYKQGSFASAESLFRAARSIHAAIRDDTSLAFRHNEGDLASALTSTGKLAEAETLGLAAMAEARRALGPVHPGVANALSNLAALRSAQGDLANGERYLREALAIFAQLHDREYSEHGIALLNLGFALKWRGAYMEADSALRAALVVFARTHTQRQWDGYALLQLAHVHAFAGRWAQATREIHAARTALQASGVTASHPDYARAIMVEAQILTSLGRAREAEALIRGVLPGGIAPQPPHNARTAELLGTLGRALAAEGKTAEAGPLLAQCHADLKRTYGAADARTRWAALADSAFVASSTVIIERLTSPARPR